MEQNNNTLWQIIKMRFNALPDKENEEETIRQISGGVNFRGSNLWVLIFAIFIASLGLNTNSTAVIIGAMLISPLMGPIIGMGLAIGINDLELLKSSIKNYMVATVISVLTATIYFVITPLTEAQSELLARTSPTLYDVLIALCGGAAGILALSTKGKGNVIPGVAIATALMPPLCTAGYGLAVGNLYYFFGAFYLFFINTVFICLATYIGVRMLRFKPKIFLDQMRMKKVQRYIVTLVVLTMLPAAYMTVQIIKRSIYDNNATKFVKNELSFSGTQIISQNLNDKDNTLNIVAVGKQISDSDITRASRRLAQYNLESYTLNVIQGSQSDSLIKRFSNVTTTTEVSRQKLLEQSAQISALETQLAQYTGYESLGKEVSREVSTIFPDITKISIANVIESRTDTAQYTRYVLTVIESRKKMGTTDTDRLQKWLKARTKADSVRVIVDNQN